MAPPSAISDPEIGASAEQDPQTSTVSLTTTAVSPHLFVVDDSQYPPDFAQAQREPGQLGESDFPDGSGSGSLFSMYLDRAEEDDRKTAEGWKRDADGVLAFSGLFSVAVAVLLTVTVRDIRPDSQDTSAYYLANILQQLSQSNGTQIAIPSTLRNPGAPFTPPTWAVWVNGLWFMSLLTSLTCALLAMFVQQWARRYLRVAYPRYSPHKRARIRTFYANGVEKLCLPQISEALPALLHISFFLFLAGLSVFCFSFNLSIFKVVIVWVGICVSVYAYLTTSPFLRKDSPYLAPLSALLSFILTDIRFTFAQIAARFHRSHPSVMQPHIHYSKTLHLDDFFSHHMNKKAEQFALKQGPEIDHDALTRLFQSLDGDDELEQFFEAVSVTCGAKAASDAQLGFVQRNEKTLSSALIGLMDRTLSSNLVSEAVKLRRMIICTKAVDVTSLLGPWWFLRRVLLGDWEKFLGWIEFGLFVQNWKNVRHPVTRFYGQCVAAVTISTVQERNDRWFQLASGPLGASTDMFRDYLKHADTILLANAIYIVRQTIETYSGSPDRHRSDILTASSTTLESLRRLDVSRTYPELQHEFCSVWNQLVDLAQNDERPDIVRVSQTVLKHIRELYIGLHKGTSAYPTAFSSVTDDSDPVLDDPNSYRKCSIARHRPSQPAEELHIEEPVPEVAAIRPPTPGFPLWTDPVSHQQGMLLQMSSPTKPSRSRGTAPAPSFPQPTHLSASHVHPQTTFVPATPPSIVPTPPVEQVTSILPGQQPALTVPFISGGPNEGVSSAPSLSSSGQPRRGVL